jgi:hypothetical protein
MREPQVAPPWAGRRYPSGWGLGFMLFDWNGRPVVGHDGGTPGQTACWRIVPDRDVVFAVNVNGGGAAALIDDVMTAVLKEVADVDVPQRERPPTEPVRFDANGYTGTFAGPLTTYEVALADGGLDVTTTPKGIATDLGMRPKTARYLALGQDRFVAAEPDEGAHPVIVFVDQGRYLHNSRALPRVG